MSKTKCDHCGARWGFGDNQWIFVEDRFPSIGERVLVYKKSEVYGNKIEIRYRVDDCFWNDQHVFSIISYISHWMPLPTFTEINEYR